MAIALVLGLTRVRWWAPALLSVVFTAATVAVVHSWWIETGLIHSWQRGLTLIFIGYFATAFFGYGIGRTISRMRTSLASRRLPDRDTHATEERCQ
jgi:hypothetical protein